MQWAIGAVVRLAAFQCADQGASPCISKGHFVFFYAQISKNKSKKNLHTYDIIYCDIISRYHMSCTLAQKHQAYDIIYMISYIISYMMSHMMSHMISYYMISYITSHHDIRSWYHCWCYDITNIMWYHTFDYDIMFCIMIS